VIAASWSGHRFIISMIFMAAPFPYRDSILLLTRAVKS